MSEKEYKEDSTKGSSILQPLNYKNDVSTQAWIDSRVLATLSDWLDKNGEYPRHLSQVVRRPLELLCDMLVRADEVEMVDDTALARFMLQKKYDVNLNRGGRGGKNVLHNQILSDKRKRLNFNFTKPLVPDANVSMGKQKTNIDSDELAKLTEVYNNLSAIQGQTKEESLQAAIDSGCIVEEDVHQLRKLAKQKEMHEAYVAKKNTPAPTTDDRGIKEGMSECELDKYDKKRDAERIALENQEPDLSKMQFADETE